jgi:hypothetical protein
MPGADALLSTSPQRLAFYFFDESILDFNFHACTYTEWAMVLFKLSALSYFDGAPTDDPRPDFSFGAAFDNAGEFVICYCRRSNTLKQKYTR